MCSYVAFDERATLLLVGAEGSGKTALLRTWCDRFEQARARDVFFLQHFDTGAAGVESARGILRRCLFEMKRHCGLDDEVPTDYIQIKRTFLVWLQACPSPPTRRSRPADAKPLRPVPSCEALTVSLVCRLRRLGAACCL